MQIALVCGAAGVISLAGHVTAGPFGTGTGGANITRVEEDWQITTGTPDPNLNAPQVTMTMSPYSGVAGYHAVFEINSQTQPNYSAGGLQLQSWYGSNCWGSVSPGNPAVMQTQNEVVSFTMSMEVGSNNLTFGVSNGSSQTWGSFGTGQSLTQTVSFDGNNLNFYDPTSSLSNSYVGFGCNRVQQVVRTAVRYYSNGVLQSTDTTQQILWQYSGE